MDDLNEQCAAVNRKKNGSFLIWIKHAAIPVLAGMSACFMAVWLYGQVERNLDQWNLKQMKVSVPQQTDHLTQENPQPEIRKEPVQTLKKVRIKNQSKKAAKSKSRPQKLAQYKEMSELHMSTCRVLRLQT